MPIFTDFDFGWLLDFAISVAQPSLLRKKVAPVILGPSPITLLTALKLENVPPVWRWLVRSRSSAEDHESNPHGLQLGFVLALPPKSPNQNPFYKQKKRRKKNSSPGLPALRNDRNDAPKRREAAKRLGLGQVGDVAPVGVVEAEVPRAHAREDLGLEERPKATGRKGIFWQLVGGALKESSNAESSWDVLIDSLPSPWYEGYSCAINELKSSLSPSRRLLECFFLTICGPWHRNLQRREGSRKARCTWWSAMSNRLQNGPFLSAVKVQTWQAYTNGPHVRCLHNHLRSTEKVLDWEISSVCFKMFRQRCNVCKNHPCKLRPFSGDFLAEIRSIFVKVEALNLGLRASAASKRVPVRDVGRKPHQFSRQIPMISYVNLSTLPGNRMKQCKMMFPGYLGQAKPCTKYLEPARLSPKAWGKRRKTFKKHCAAAGLWHNVLVARKSVRSEEEEVCIPRWVKRKPSKGEGNIPNWRDMLFRCSYV